MHSPLLLLKLGYRTEFSTGKRLNRLRIVEIFFMHFFLLLLKSSNSSKLRPC